MGRITIEQLGPMLKERRGNRSIREVARQIEISAATLSRIESGKQPDIETFSKICKWLGLDAGEVLGCSVADKAPPSAPTTLPPTFSAHFRAEKTMSAKTAQHLGQLILAVQRAVEKETSG